MAPVLTVTLNPAIDLSTVTGSIQAERKNRCWAVQRDPGGGGINVARVLKRLGTDCRALYPAGGSPGALLHQLLDKEGIHSVAVAISGDTRENFTVREAASGDQFRFVLPGPALRPSEWFGCLECMASLPPAEYVVLSGSLPPGVPAELYRRIVHCAAERGARVVVDTSGPALASALEQGVYLVKPNLRELAELTGRALDDQPQWIDAAADLVERGRAQVVALTLGHRGALLVTRGRRLYAPAIPVTVESAVGAGDSFLGGMVCQLAGGADLIDAFRYGVAAGTAALLTPGTELCRAADVERLAAEVQLTELDASGGGLPLN